MFYCPLPLTTSSLLSKAVIVVILEQQQYQWFTYLKHGLIMDFLILSLMAPKLWNSFGEENKNNAVWHHSKKNWKGNFNCLLTSICCWDYYMLWFISCSFTITIRLTLPIYSVYILAHVYVCICVWLYLVLVNYSL